MGMGKLFVVLANSPVLIFAIILFLVIIIEALGGIRRTVIDIKNKYLTK